MVRDVLATELGSPIETVFAVFAPQPMAAASIGQVHAATLPDGSEVIVKIRRPGVVEQIELDLQILEATVRPISRLSTRRAATTSRSRRRVPTTLRSELDYQREASNVERFAANFAGDAFVHIPRVYRERSTRRVLTLERLRGLKVDDIAVLDRAGIDRPALAQHAATVTLRMIFEHGFFHADPHPGDFFIETDGRIGLIDFGMVGTVDPATRAALPRRTRCTRRAGHRTAGRCLRRARHDHHTTRPQPARPRHRQPDLAPSVPTTRRDQAGNPPSRPLRHHSPPPSSPPAEPGGAGKDARHERRDRRPTRPVLRDDHRDRHLPPPSPPRRPRARHAGVRGCCEGRRRW